VGDEVYCTAELNYLRRDRTVAVRTDILDGRVATDIDFERCGFTLVEHPSRCTAWTDAQAVGEQHGPEVERFAVDFAGCDRAMVYPPIIRSREMAQRIPDYHPIEFVHSDFTDDYGAMIVDVDRPYGAFLEPLLARHGLTRDDVAGASRVMMLQLWRSTGPVAADYPLAMCRADDVDRSRLVPEVVASYGGRHLEFEVFGVRAPPIGHRDRWYTFPSMRPDEAIAIRTYDSACIEGGRPFWTPHSAFRDPRVPATPEHFRESVEMRALCLWN